MNSTRNVRLEMHVVTRAGGLPMHVCRALVTYPARPEEGYPHAVEVVAHEVSRWSAETARRDMIAWLRSRKLKSPGVADVALLEVQPTAPKAPELD